MKALTPQDLKQSYDQQKVDEIIEKFNKKLLEENKEQHFYHVVIEGEYSRILLVRVEEAYRKAGWNNVECRTSNEKGERPGLTGLQLLR